MSRYTHVGCRPHVGHVHCGAKLWGHRAPKAGRRHALNGGPKVFVGLCGARVTADEYDDFGFRRERGPDNVSACGPAAPAVTCKRCLRLIARAEG